MTNGAVWAIRLKMVYFRRVSAHGRRRECVVTTRRRPAEYLLGPGVN